MNETFKKPPLLVRLALFFSPAEFRRRYADEIYRDSAGGEILRAAADAFFAGVGMRFEDLWRDLCLGVRSLRKAPLFAIVSVATIAVAVGLNTAMASIVGNILLRPLPYPDSGRLVFVTENLSFGPFTTPSYPDIQDLRRGNTTLVTLSASRWTLATLLRMGAPQKLRGRLVDGEYFKVLGMRPELGRTLSDGDIGKGILISDRLWHKQFGGSLGAIGRTVHLDGTAYRIAGVVPAAFNDLDGSFFHRADYWLRIDPAKRRQVDRGGFNYTAIGKLRPGISLAAAQADVRRVMANVANRYAQNHKVYGGSSVTPALQTIVLPMRYVLWLLYAAVGIVLVVALVNLANLQLVRLTARQGDLTVREWLGASNRRLAAQLGAETAIVAAIGSIAGVALAAITIPVIGRLGANQLPRWDAVGIDFTLLLYALALCVAATFACGVLPVFLRKGTLAEAGGRGGTQSRSEGRLRSAFVTLQVALAMALAVAAGLILRSYVMLVNGPVGFDPANLLFVDASNVLALSSHDVRDAVTISRFVHRIQAIPGVQSVAGAISVPFTNNFDQTTFQVPGRPESDDFITFNAVSAGYFGTLHIPILFGRDFSRNDLTTSIPVAIVSRSFAYKYFGSQHAIGKTVIPGDGPARRYRIVGVVSDVRSSLSASPESECYVTQNQLPWMNALVIRTTGTVGGLPRTLQRTIEAVNPDAVPPAITPFSDLFAADAMRARVAMQLFGLLACVAAGLAISGIYAVCAFGVSRRTHEFGVRLAAGAPQTSILLEVLLRATIWGVTGVATGTIIAAATTHLLSGLLYRTSPLDPSTFVAVAGIIIACTAAAALVPAFRATRVDPAVALRYE